MAKTKIKKLIIFLVVFSLIGLNIQVPQAKALAMDNIIDTLSDSTAGISANHTIVFNLGTALTAGQYVDVDFETGDFDLFNATGTCPTGTTLSTTTDQLTCTGAMSSTTDLTIEAINVINPSVASSSYTVSLTSYTSSGIEIETITTRVYIVYNVYMTATVNATLLFTVDGMSSGQTANGITCTENSTSTSTPFGVLNAGASKTVCQLLKVSTNAGYGYTVTVEQTQDLTNGSDDTINAFVDAVTSTSTAWVSPTGNIADPDTYGHMGLSSSDSSLDGSNYDGDTNPYASSKYIGFNGTSTRQVMYHTSVADGNTTEGQDYARIAYTAEISALQEAGDYDTTLKYIITALF